MQRTASLTLFAVLTLLGLSSPSEARRAAPPAKKHVFHGHIVHVHHARGATHATLTVRHQGGHHHKFTITAQTRIDHGKGKVAVGFGHLHAGQHVRIHHNGHHATEVTLVHKKKT